VLHDEFFHMMRRILQEHTARWQDAGIPLTKPQYAVLRAIDEAPGGEQTALAAASATTKAGMTEILARLETVGFIERRPDATDRRKRFVFLTAAGQGVLATAREQADRVNESFLRHLDPGGRKLLGSLLEQLETESEETRS
jgi:DNA-binding MarR family transcriptional regulator